MILDKFELVFLTFFLIANLFIFFNFDFLKKNIRIFDNPDHILKRHKKKTSLLGGTILIFNFLLFFFFKFFFRKKSNRSWKQRNCLFFTFSNFLFSNWII